MTTRDCLKAARNRGRGGGQMVSVLPLYSDEPSSNPADSTVFILLSCLKRMKINKKEAGDGPFFKKTRQNSKYSIYFYISYILHTMF